MCKTLQIAARSGFILGFIFAAAMSAPGAQAQSAPVALAPAPDTVRMEAAPRSLTERYAVATPAKRELGLLVDAPSDASSTDVPVTAAASSQVVVDLTAVDGPAINALARNTFALKVSEVPQSTGLQSASQSAQANR